MAQHLDFAKLIPNYVKNETNEGLMGNLFNKFVSQENSLFVAGNIGRISLGEEKITMTNLERQENSLVPGFFYTAGTEKMLFTFDDLVNRVKVIDCDVEHMRTWMGEVNYNFSPPIDYDKLVNYNNYYWIGEHYKADSVREYYVIAKPRKTDLKVKMPVVAATTRPVNLWTNDRPPETITLTFTSSSTFTIDSDISPGAVFTDLSVGTSLNPINSNPGDITRVVVKAYSTGSIPSIDNGLGENDLVEMFINIGQTAFSAGDTISIKIVHFTSNTQISVDSVNLAGKGTVTGVRTISPYIFIDGQEMKAGDRILVFNQADPADNGIYDFVIGNQWVRSADASLTQHFIEGQDVYVERGDVHGGKTFTLFQMAQVNSGRDEPIDAKLYYMQNASATPGVSNLNDWQAANFWVHRDDIKEYANKGINLNNVKQAQRPIIEYFSSLQLNGAYDADYQPCDPSDPTATLYTQRKINFNQVPQFDLYRYDGTHSGLTSGIWFFKESQSAPIDNVLQRRIIMNENDDVVFGLGIKDKEDRLLFFKSNNQLTSIWKNISEQFPVRSIVTFTGKNKSNLQVFGISNIAKDTDSQTWSVVFTDSQNADVVGSRSGKVGTITVGEINKQFDDFNMSFYDAGLTYFENDKYEFKIINKSMPRYVKEQDGEIINFPRGSYENGYIADHSSPQPEGTWLTPARMFQNMNRETRDTINFADFANHARSVMSSQIDFVGSPSGLNNFRNITLYPGLGGQIREFGSNFPLLVSMLIQQDISPLTIIDFAEQQYIVALSSIDQFVMTELLNYSADGNQIDQLNQITLSDTQVDALYQAFMSFREADVNLSDVFDDSTAKVSNWPATLPMLGLAPKVQPSIVLHEDLNAYVIVHHDGHVSYVANQDAQFNAQMAKTSVVRSDGTTSAGIFAENVNGISPYANQLWLKPSTGELKRFNARFDTEDEPTVSGVQHGALWIKRSTQEIFSFDANTLSWHLTSLSVVDVWTPLHPENVRNNLVLRVEQELYDSVHAFQELKYDLTTAKDKYKELEYIKFAAKYKYDLNGIDYKATNPFTWNYSGATLPELTSVPARWYDLYSAYYAATTGFAMTRPDLEPWKFGTIAIAAQEDEPSAWAQYRSSAQTTANTTAAKVVMLDASTSVPFGLQLVDGVQLNNGDQVVIANAAQPELNGLYFASSVMWGRLPTALDEGLTIQIQEGNYAGTNWVVTTAPNTLDTDPVVIEQARVWKQEMWNDIILANPGVKLSVNIYNDTLLPPYVDAQYPISSQALFNTIPSSASDSYVYGDNGPIELVWKNSVEYGYGLARAAFRSNALSFLDKVWGETYTITGSNNLRLERNLQASLPSSSFLMHGERLNKPNVLSPEQARRRFIVDGIIQTVDATFSGNVEFKVSHTSLLSNSGLGASGTVFDVFINGAFTTQVFEGVQFTLSTPFVEFVDVTIEDRGIPFEYGDTLIVHFEKDTVTQNMPEDGVDFVYGVLGCEGCVADATPDPFIIVEVVKHDPTFSFVGAQTKVFNGLGQWFTNLLRYNQIDTDISVPILAYRGWDTKLVHRIGGLIRPDTLEVKSNFGTIPNIAYFPMIKRSVSTQSLWISGLRIELLDKGSVIKKNGIEYPSADASDWTFRIEGYNTARPFIDVDILDASGEFVTFNVLDRSVTDTVWNKYTDIIETKTIALPQTITGLQNVLNLVFGYVSQLTRNNFKVVDTEHPLIDAATGRLIDWQLEIEKFIETTYSGIEVGEVSVLNPFMDKLQLATPIGLMGRFNETNFLDPYSSQACFDVLGKVIRLNNLSVLRSDAKTVTYSRLPIFSAHVMLDTFEHAIVFNSHFSSEENSPTIFDQFLGLAMPRAYLSYYRNSDQLGKPTFDGYVISGDNMLPNISTDITALNHSYDATMTFENPEMSRHALSLIGFNTKESFNSLDISPKVQLDFWRGMINAKGTNKSVSAFTQYKAFENSSIDEFWAYKQATFGDSRENTLPEIKIQPNDCIRQFTSLQFIDAMNPSSDISLFTKISSSDDDRWVSSDDVGTVMKFEAEPLSEYLTVTEPGLVKLTNTYHNGDEYVPRIFEINGTTLTENQNCSIVNASVAKITAPGQYLVKGFTWGNTTQVSPIVLYDASEKTKIATISLWHPAISIHAPAPQELIHIRSGSDPANYNYSTQKVNNPNHRQLKPWGSEEVGKVWWNTSSLGFIPYYDATIFKNREARNSRWGKMAEWASIDLYQWTESDVHPSEYDVLASIQEGDSSIDISQRKSGRVGFKNYYSSDRSVFIRPIAWSEAGTNNAAAHPSFPGKADSRIFYMGDQLFIDSGRLTDAGLTANRNFCAWNIIDSKPISECVIGENVTWTIGDFDDLKNDQLSPTVINTVSDISLSVVQLPKSSTFGSIIGRIQLSCYEGADSVLYAELSTEEEDIERIEIVDVVSKDWTIQDDADPLDVNSRIYHHSANLNFDTFGIRIAIRASSLSPKNVLTANEIMTIVGRQDFVIREGVDIEEIVPLNANQILSNTYVFGDATTSDYGWKVWNVPTQAQLNSDLPYPRNKWKPYLGDQIEVDISSELIEQMNKDKLALVTGIPIKRFESKWSNWIKLADTKVSLLGTGSLLDYTFDFELDASRLSVYVNGIQLNPDQLSILDNNVMSVAPLPEGAEVVILYRGYQPTDDELEFDPDVAEDFTRQTKFKEDYDYTFVVTRDNSGNISGTKYYFWVKDKSIPEVGKSLSLSQAASLLENGESNYALLARMTEVQNEPAFDSCSISNLGHFVTKMGAFKLRFTRDFTLRHDPNEIDLKNTHTEWTLIREHQKSKIPKALWDALTNSICAQDTMGNILPSPIRIMYDEKHNTRTRYGFGAGQIFIDTDLALRTVINTILNPANQIKIGSSSFTDYITFLGVNANSSESAIQKQWFSSARESRNTMNLIYDTARASQVNEIFFNSLYDALANNHEFTDLFKTSLITISTTSKMEQRTESEQLDAFY